MDPKAPYQCPIKNSLVQGEAKKGKENLQNGVKEMACFRNKSFRVFLLDRINRVLALS